MDSGVTYRSEKKSNYRYTQEICEIVKKVKITKTVFDFTLSAPAIAKAAKVGQFVNIICGEKMLRRPISLCGFESLSETEGTIRIVFEVRGEGTEWLSQRSEGESLDIVGPLGHGFPLFDADKRVILVGGGIGTPPLLPIAKHYGENTTSINGFRSQDFVILKEDFEKHGASIVVCTDDGSCGIKGFTTESMEQLITKEKFDFVYTCGPQIMMKKVAEIAERAGIRCFVSMEERMACGVGVCHGCGCETKTRDGKGTEMRRVCLNGPVFESTEVVW